MIAALLDSFCWSAAHFVHENPSIGQFHLIEPPFCPREPVDQQLLRVTNHIAQVSTVRGHFGELRKNLYHLRRSTEQSGRLTFSRDDKKLAHREATKLLMSFEDVDRKWKGMLMESGPPSGTVKRLGRT